MADFDNSQLTSVPTPEADDALMFELSGLTIGWRPSGLALDRAQSQGVSVGKILADLQALFASDLTEDDLEEMSEEEVAEALDGEATLSDTLGVVSQLVWVGALHFEESIRQDAVQAIIDPENVGDVPVEEMLARIFPALDEERAEGKAAQATSPR
jgi:hypothetical protein